jgi:transcription elongation factor Elf1
VNTVNCHHCGSRLVSVEALIRGGTEHTCGLCGRQWWSDGRGVVRGSREPDVRAKNGNTRGRPAGMRV